MQHEMRPAMHEEHVLREIIDMRLQNGIEGEHADNEACSTPRSRPLFARHRLPPAPVPGQRQSRRQKRWPGEFPRHPERKLGWKEAAQDVDRTARKEQRAKHQPFRSRALHSGLIKRVGSTLRGDWSQLHTGALQGGNVHPVLFGEHDLPAFRGALSSRPARGLRQKWHELARDRHNRGAARPRLLADACRRRYAGAGIGLSGQDRCSLFRLHALSGHLPGDAGKPDGRDSEARVECERGSRAVRDGRPEPRYGTDPCRLCPFVCAPDRRSSRQRRSTDRHRPPLSRRLQRFSGLTGNILTK